MELRHTIQLISALEQEINEIESAIEEMMNSIQSPITTIPGIGFRMGVMILAEVGDFSNFDSQIKSLPTQDFLHRLMNPVNFPSPEHIPTWRNAVPITFDTPFSTQQSLYASGDLPRFTYHKEI